MTSEKFWHQGGEWGQEGRGGRKPAEVKIVVFFLEMAWTPLPPQPGGWETEVKTSFQGMKLPESFTAKATRMVEGGQGPGTE